MVLYRVKATPLIRVYKIVAGGESCDYWQRIVEAMKLIARLAVTETEYNIFGCVSFTSVTERAHLRASR